MKVSNPGRTVRDLRAMEKYDADLSGYRGDNNDVFLISIRRESTTNMARFEYHAEVAGWNVRFHLFAFTRWSQSMILLVM